METPPNDFTTFLRKGGRFNSVVTAIEIPEAARGMLPWAVMARVPFRRARDRFMSDRELTRITRIREQIERSLASVRGTYVGHVHTEGISTAFFYAALRPVEKVEIREGLFRKRVVDLEVRHDPGWQVYETHLQPSEGEKTLLDSEQLWDVLAQQGDRMSIARDVDFTAIFPSPAPRDAFLQDAFALGFTLGEEGVWEDEIGRSWCVVKKRTPVERAALVPEISRLRSLIQRHGGEFDGWATRLVTEGP